MGIFEGAGIHGTEETRIAGQRRLARLRADVDPRRDRTVPAGRSRNPDLHRLTRPGRRSAANFLHMTWDSGARRLRPRPARARLAERTRRAYGGRPRPVRRVGRRAGPRARRRRATATCAATRPALSSRGRRARHGRPQARRDPRPLRLPRPHRAGRPEPGRPRLQPEAAAEAAAGADRRADAHSARADPGAHAAGAARPGDARARLLLRAALRGDRQPRHRLLRLRDRAAAGARQGLEGAAAAGRRAGPAGAAPLPASAAAARSPPIRASSALFLSKSGRRLSNSDVTRRLGLWVREAALAGGVSPHSLRHSLRDPPARGRRGSAYDPGAARPLLDLDHAGLHPGRRRPAARHLRGHAIPAHESQNPAERP